MRTFFTDFTDQINKIWKGTTQKVLEILENAVQRCAVADNKQIIALDDVLQYISNNEH